MNKIIDFFYKEIIKKNQINGIEEEFLKERIRKYFLKNGNKRKEIERILIENSKPLTNKKIKNAIKEIKSEIGDLYGCFLTSNFKKKEKFLEENKIEEILKSHKSSRERSENYKEIYQKIFQWHKPKIISDIACGLNPISYEIIKDILKYNPEYFSYDLNKKDMEFIKKYFQKNNIRGDAISINCASEKILKENGIKKSDLIFLFKAIDSFEKINKNFSKKLIKEINSKKIVVSFPTKSIKSKIKIKKEKRNWFYKFLDEEKYKYEEFETENEKFILITKN